MGKACVPVGAVTVNVFRLVSDYPVVIRIHSYIHIHTKDILGKREGETGSDKRKTRLIGQHDDWSILRGSFRYVASIIFGASLQCATKARA